MSEYDNIAEARKLMGSQSHGILSTLSRDNGYPFGSLTPYALDITGEPIILISTIAEHTKNIDSDPRVSITITEAMVPGKNIQASGRMTYVGNAVKEKNQNSVKDLYLKQFPEASKYFQTHGFFFYRIKLEKARFIGGFGKIFWLTPEELLIRRP